MRTCLALAASCLIATATARAVDYSIDADHSTIGFKVKHLAISNVHGKFSDVKGTFSFDPAKIESSSVTAEIAAQSIDTRQEKRDKHLRSGDFLLADEHPLITFKSTKVTDVRGSKFKVHGDLEIRGVKKPVVLDVEYGGAAADPWGNQRAAFVATTAINRKDFGVNYHKVLDNGGLVVGDDVTITLEIEGIQKKDA